MKPIIKVIQQSLDIQFENEVMKAVRKAGFVVDSERLARALKDARVFYDEGYEAGYAAALMNFDTQEEE